MVQFTKRKHQYDEPTYAPILAYYVRYPNPFARHVLSVDVLDRWLNPTTGQLHTTRLILKRGIIPKWASKWLPTSSQSGGRGLDAWVLEESIVDPPGWGEGSSSQAIIAEPGVGGIFGRGKGKWREQENSGEYAHQPRLRSRQANLNHKKFMHIVEGGEIFANAMGSTIHRITAEVKSDFGGTWSSLIRQRIESYAIGKFETNSESSRKGMSLVLTRLRSRQPIHDTAEFYPPPPPQFSEAWPAPGAAAGPGASAGSPLERAERRL